MSAISSQRYTPADPTDHLGLLADLAGNWAGHGFNLIARPDFVDKTDLYLQLNKTREQLHFTPIGSPIPNRGFLQDDIELHGLTYLQKISDAGHDGALHIEPGIWVVQPNTDHPHDHADRPAQLIARMSTIPHGNSVLAQGIAEPFKGAPVITTPGSQYSFSRFPSFNSTPFGAPPTVPGIVVNAAGTSEKLAAAAIPPAPGFPPPPPPFPQYDLGIPEGPIAAGSPSNPPFTLNTRTPYGTVPPENPLPPSIHGVAMQDVVNDPIRILQAEVETLVASGHTFEGVVLNVATQTPISFLTTPNSSPTGPTVSVAVPQFSGGVENIRFLTGVTKTVAGKPEIKENAQTALVYATFWIEKVTHKASGRHFMQLQYAQMVVLDFPVFHTLHQPPHAYINLGWPHISVATLRRNFG